MSERTAPAVSIRLKSVREAKGIPLREIANATKIATRTLAAVEQGELSKLPGGIYMRSVIRSYASAVGLDPDETLAEFIAQCPGRIDPVPTLETDKAELAAAPASWWRRVSRILPVFRKAGAPVAMALAAVYAGVSWTTTRPDAVLPSSAIDVLAVHGLSAAPVEPAVMRVARLLNGDSGEGALPAIVHSPLRIDVRPEARCWISLDVDGGETESRLLEAGERLVIEAEREVVLKVGDAGAVAVWINGQAAQPLGAAGQVATVHISAENFPQFLGS